MGRGLGVVTFNSERPPLGIDVAIQFSIRVQQALSHVLFRPTLPVPTEDDFAERKLNGIDFG
jgi:hypothetical protein